MGEGDLQVNLVDGTVHQDWDTALNSGEGWSIETTATGQVNQLLEFTVFRQKIWPPTTAEPRCQQVGKLLLVTGTGLGNPGSPQ